MPAKTKSKKKKTLNSKRVMNFKVNNKQRNEIVSLAKRLTRGNVTALVLAGLANVNRHATEIKKGQYRASTRK